MSSYVVYRMSPVEAAVGGVFLWTEFGRSGRLGDSLRTLSREKQLMIEKRQVLVLTEFSTSVERITETILTCVKQRRD